MIEEHLAAQDWAVIASDLDARGFAVLPAILSAPECAAIAGFYPERERFRSRVVMAQHNFGRGEYQYFSYPLPAVVADLRTALYPPLAPIANRWQEALGIEARFPAAHATYVAHCHRAGQSRPTPLLLKYEAGDYNALHQDLYGDEVFPFQATFLLSDPRHDFTGGEFVLVEQRGTARYYRVNDESVACFPTAADVVMGRSAPARPDRVDETEQEWWRR